MINIWDLTYKLASKTPTPIQRGIGAVLGKTGKLIESTRPITGGRGEFRISEQLERLGGMLRPRPVWGKEPPPQEKKNQPPPQNKTISPPPPSSTYSSQQSQQPAQSTDEVSRWYQEQPSWEEQQRQQMIDMINREYENEMRALSAEEAALPGRYEAFKQAISANLAPVLTSLQQARQEKLAGLSTEEAGIKQQAAMDLRQIHQLLSDLQQKQAGYLSSIGGWTSTVAPAMAEAFGRRAYESISDLQRRRDLALADINRRITATNEFYNQKIADFENQKATKLNLLEQDLQDSLREIAQRKERVAEAKARATFEAWQNYLNTRRQLALEEARWKQALALWKQQMDQQLALAKQSLAEIQPAYTYQSPSPQPYEVTTPTPSTPPLPSPNSLLAMAPVRREQPTKRAGETDEEYYARLLGLPSTQKETLGIKPRGIAGLYNWLA